MQPQIIYKMFVPPQLSKLPQNATPCILSLAYRKKVFWQLYFGLRLTCYSFIFYNSRCTTRLTRRVPLVEQELLTFTEYQRSHQVFIVVRLAQSSVFYVVFLQILVCLFSSDYCALRFADSDCPFGIFKFFVLFNI